MGTDWGADFAATFAPMDEGDVMLCSVCWAVVPQTLMHFHRRWHDESECSHSREVGCTTP